MMRTSNSLVLVVLVVASVMRVAMGCMLAHTPHSLGTFRKSFEYKLMMRTSNSLVQVAVSAVGVSAVGVSAEVSEEWAEEEWAEVSAEVSVEVWALCTSIRMQRVSYIFLARAHLPHSCSHQCNHTMPADSVAVGHVGSRA
jgi:hypothetical protein